MRCTRSFLVVSARFCLLSQVLQRELNRMLLLAPWFFTNVGLVPACTTFLAAVLATLASARDVSG